MNPFVQKPVEIENFEFSLSAIKVGPNAAAEFVYTADRPTRIQKLTLLDHNGAPHENPNTVLRLRRVRVGFTEQFMALGEVCRECGAHKCDTSFADYLRNQIAFDTLPTNQRFSVLLYNPSNHTLCFALRFSGIRSKEIPG